MEKIPFSIYDFFGYLAPGILLVGSIDYFFIDQQLIKYAGENFLTGLISILLIYIIGHIISTPSYWLLEKVIIDKNLKPPRETLFQDKTSIMGFKKLFSSYYNPFSEKVRNEIFKSLEIGKDIKLNDEICKGIYQLAYSKVKIDEQSMLSLNTFLYLYGFARSISLTCFVVVIMLLISSIISGAWNNAYWILAFVVAGITMFYRFLKFYRYYSYDMFLSFLSLIEKKDDKTK
jgi:hypothetical protein